MIGIVTFLLAFSNIVVQTHAFCPPIPASPRAAAARGRFSLAVQLSADDDVKDDDVDAITSSSRVGKGAANRSKDVREGSLMVAPLEDDDVDAISSPPGWGNEQLVDPKTCEKGH